MAVEIDIEEIARRLKVAQDEVRQIEPVTSRVPGFELCHGYQVAQWIHDARLAEGASAVGRKIGFTNSALWPRFGVRAPIWGYVYDTTVTHVRDEHGECSIGRLAEPKIEPEIVVHLREAPPADADLEAMLECVDWVAHGFEMVQSHYPGWRFQAPDTVADSALHGALLIGEPLAVSELGADAVGSLESFSLTLSRDGEMLETGKGANVLGGPLAAVAHLVTTLAEQPQYPPLRAGELVTTGTLTAAYDVTAGQRWSTELRAIGLRGLSVEIVG